MTHVLVILAGFAIAFCAGVAEAQRVINAIEGAIKQVHDRLTSADKVLHERLTALEEAIKAKL